jgi:hypothetical protein
MEMVSGYIGSQSTTDDEEYDGEGKGEDEVIEEAMIPWGDSMLLDDDNEGGEHE